MHPSGAVMVGGTSSGMGVSAGQLGSYFTGTKGGRQMFRQLMGMFGPDAANNDPDVTAAALQDLARIDLTAELPKISMPLTVRSEEHTSELQSLMRISYAVFCLKKKT